MLKTQKKFLNYLHIINDEISKYEIFNNKNILNLIENIKNQELIIPVIGGYSAGKSTALNSFIGKNILPVNIPPETDLAAEIRFDEDERIEAVKNDIEIDRYKLDEFNKIKENSGNYRYLRIFVNSENIKNTQPLILVDMPGFESPFDRHNRAIIEYIKKGVFYIVLISVTDGTINREILSELHNLNNLNKDFIVILSRIDLRDKETVKEVKENVSDILEFEFNYEKEIPTIEEKVIAFHDILSSLNPEELFEQLFIDLLKNLYFDLLDDINIAISSLSKNKEENENYINELQESLEELKEEKLKLINSAKDKYSNIQIKYIVSQVINEIRNRKSEFATNIANGNINGFNKKIENLIRYTLTANLKQSIENISLDILNDITSKLEQNKNYIEPSIMENISNSIKVFIKRGNEKIQEIAHEQKNKENEGKEKKEKIKTIISIIAILTDVLSPVLEALIVLLPDVLEKLFKHSQIKQIEQIIEEEIIPQIQYSLESELENLLSQQVNFMIESISEEFERKLKEKKAILEKVSKQKEEEIHNLDNTINKYKELEKHIKNYSEFLFKGQ